MIHSISVRNILRNSQIDQDTLTLSDFGNTYESREYQSPSHLLTDIFHHAGLLGDINARDSTLWATLLLDDRMLPHVEIEGDDIVVSPALESRCLAKDDRLTYSHPFYSFSIKSPFTTDISSRFLRIESTSNLPQAESHNDVLAFDYDPSSDNMNVLSRSNLPYSQMMLMMLYNSGLLANFLTLYRSNVVEDQIAHLDDALTFRAAFEPWGSASFGRPTVRICPKGDRYDLGLSSRYLKVPVDSVSFNPENQDASVVVSFGLFNAMVHARDQHESWKGYFGSEYTQSDV